MHPLYFILGFPLLVYGIGVWVYTLAQFPFAAVYRNRGMLAYVKGPKYTTIVCFRKQTSFRVFRFAAICQIILLVGLLPVLISWTAGAFMLCSISAGLLAELYSRGWLRQLGRFVESTERYDALADERVVALGKAFQLKNISSESIRPRKFDRTATRLSVFFCLLDILSLVLVASSIEPY